MTCLAMTQCSRLVPRKPVCLLGVKLAGLLLLRWCIAAKGTAQHVCVLTRWQGCRWTRHGFCKMFSLGKNLEVLPWCVWKYNTQHGLYMHVRAWGSVRRGRVYVICVVAEQNQQCPFGTSTSWGWQAHRMGTVHLNCACPSGKRKCHAFRWVDILAVKCNLHPFKAKLPVTWSRLGSGLGLGSFWWMQMDIFLTLQR